MRPSRTWTRALAAALALPASACGQTTPSYPPLVETTGGAGGSTTTDATGMGGSGGTGSTSGAGCAVGGFTGTLGGIDVSGALTLGFFINAAELDLWPFGFGGDGFLLIVDYHGETAAHPLPLMRLPTAGPDPGAWYLFNSVATTKTAAGTSFTLGAAQRLGVCPGSAITGTLSFCFGPAGTAGCSGMESATSATLGGTSTTWPNGGGFDDTILFTYLAWPGIGYLADGMDLTQTKHGLLIRFPEEITLPGGSVLCVGDTHESQTTWAYGSFSDLTSLSAAPAVSGSIQGCL